MIRKIEFLDYVIVNSGNSDGWVITKPNGTFEEGHLGNYGTKEEDLHKAKKACIVHFMIARPEVFRIHVYHLTLGIGTWGSWSVFTDQLKKENIAIPDEITCESNVVIGYNGDSDLNISERHVNRKELLIESAKNRLELLN